MLGGNRPRWRRDYRAAPCLPFDTVPGAREKHRDAGSARSCSRSGCHCVFHAAGYREFALALIDLRKRDHVVVNTFLIFARLQDQLIPGGPVGAAALAMVAMGHHRGRRAVLAVITSASAARWVRCPPPRRRDQQSWAARAAMTSFAHPGTAGSTVFAGLMMGSVSWIARAGWLSGLPR